MKETTNYIVTLFLVLLSYACNNEATKRQLSENYESHDLWVEETEVEVMRLEPTSFYSELMSNGKIRAVKDVNLRFPIIGIVEKLFYKDGDYVKRGDTIAILDRRELSLQYQSALLAYNKSIINLKDRLLDYGYTIDDTILLSREQKDNIYLSCGVCDAEINLKRALYNYNGAILTAPFSGLIANMQQKIFEHSNSVVCSLLDNSYYNVHFSLLELEFNQVAPNDKVSVTLLNNKREEYSGEIISINPSVNSYGQFDITARIKGNSHMVDGMNVKVSVKRETKDQYVVPKQAVVRRDGEDVVFLYANGRSLWRYVTITMSNSTHYAIVANKERNSKLQDGDYIIISGNENLSNNNSVKIKQ